MLKWLIDGFYYKLITVNHIHIYTNHYGRYSLGNRNCNAILILLFNNEKIFLIQYNKNLNSFF